MFGGQKAAILAQVGHFYFGRWVSFTSAVTAMRILVVRVGNRREVYR